MSEAQVVPWPVAPDHAPPFVRNDGGRKAAGYVGSTGDCGVRALAIAVFGAQPPWAGIEHVGAADAYRRAVVGVTCAPATWSH